MATQTYSFTRSYPAVPETVPLARRALVEFAEAAGAEESQLDSVRLAASEAVTNAVRHAYRAGEAGQVHVTAALANDELWVLIADDGHGLEKRSHSPGLGMGLALVSTVSDDFVVLKRSSGGTELRMRFRLSGRPTMSERAADHSRGSVASARTPA
jgi:anti-sigma regulatory factor (Ser/Thr protein kinase)